MACGTAGQGEVWRVYEEAAVAFDRDRRRLAGEQAYLNNMLSRLSAGRGCVLDLGCGTGLPIARYLIEKGCEVTGVDAAPAMIAKASSRFPNVAWLERDMRGLALGRSFDAVVAWDSFFHLSPDDQRAMFAVFRGHLAPGGMLLFTSGPAAGVSMGSLYGRDLYHASLSAEEYRGLLERHGFGVVLHRVEDPACGGHTVWLAESKVPPLSRERNPA